VNAICFYPITLLVPASRRGSHDEIKLYFYILYISKTVVVHFFDAMPNQHLVAISRSCGAHETHLIGRRQNVWFREQSWNLYKGTISGSPCTPSFHHGTGTKHDLDESCPPLVDAAVGHWLCYQAVEMLPMMWSL